MANRVKISVIGARPADLEPATGHADVDRVMKHWREKLEAVLPDRPDLIVLPEFCDQAVGEALGQYRAFCQSGGESMLHFFAETAQRHRAYITYPALRRLPDGSYRNSIQLLDRKGQVCGIYNKNHPMAIGELDAGILAGREAPLFELDFGRVACAICFDLNFDELWRHYAQQRPDLILFCSVYHGGLMQAYRAYSCRCHLASAVAGLPSQIYSPVGQLLATSTNYFDFATAQVNLDCRVVHLDHHGEKLRKLKRKYGPEVSIFDPGLLAPVLVTSEGEGRSVVELLEEFGLTPLDEYLQQSRLRQAQHREA